MKSSLVVDFKYEWTELSLCRTGFEFFTFKKQNKTKHSNILFLRNHLKLTQKERFIK